MLVTAQLKYLRIAPRKVRLVADVMRGKKASEVLTQLRFLPKKSSLPLSKLLQSAMANAKNNFQLDEKDLFIHEVRVDEGPKLKRWRAVSRGRGVSIEKKTSHITLVLKGETKIKEAEKIEKKEEVTPKKVAPSKPRAEQEISPAKPKIEEKGLKKFFRRKSF